MGSLFNLSGSIGQTDASGAFSDTPSNIHLAGAYDGSYGYNRTVNLDASKSNATYSGSRLQVPALQLLACIRC